MTPEEQHELWDKEVMPFFNDWQEAVQEYQNYQGQFGSLISFKNGEFIREDRQAMTQDDVEKLDQMRKTIEEKEKKHLEAYKKWVNLIS